MRKFMYASLIAFFTYGIFHGGISPAWQAGIITALFWLIVYGLSYYQVKLIGKYFKRQREKDKSEN